MNYRKRLLSIITSLVLVLSSFLPMAAQANAAEVSMAAVSTATVSAAATSGDSYNLADSIQDGAILHAWCWSFNTISANMENIANAGFTSVQTSPINEVYKGENGGLSLSSTNNTGKWYYQYQPTNYTIGNYQLGTLAEFEAMCKVADQYGVKIIVDVVFNQMTTTGYSDIASSIKSYSNFFHNYGLNITSYYDRWNVTQYDLLGMPDINTQDTYVQSVLKAYLQACINAGADGFRYDAAKHIEVDGEYSGTFFKNVVLSNSAEFSYLEVLQDEYYSEPIPYSTYASYAPVTASNYGIKIRKAISSSGSLSTSNIMGYESEGVATSSLVTWVESHDNYCNDGSYSMSEDTVALGWAIIAARKGGTPLYFSRPMNSGTSSSTMWGNNVIGAVGSNAYKSDIVTAVNKFRNAMVGQDEYLYNSGSSVLLIERGTVGMTIVNSSYSSASVSVSSIRLADGEYIDHVSGSIFTVSGGKITGTVASRSVAVLYQVSSPVVSATPGTSTFTADSLAITLKATGTTSASYTLNAGQAVAYENGDVITIGAGDAYDTTYTLKLTATGEDGTTATATYTYTKQDPNAAITITYYNDSWTTVRIYAYSATGTTTGEALGTWYYVPSMTSNGNNTWSYTLPAGITSAYIIFHNGTVGTTSGSFSQDPSGGSTAAGYYVTQSCFIKNSTIKGYGQLNVEYIDQGGNKLADTDIYTGVEDDAYTTTAKSIQGYALTTTPANATGTYTTATTTVTYVYKEIDPEEAAVVNVLYMDEYDNVLASETMEGIIGGTYTTTAKEIAGLALQTTPDNASGTYTKEDITVTYIYGEKAAKAANTITVTYYNTYSYTNVRMYAYNNSLSPVYFLGAWNNAARMTNNGDGTWSYTFTLPTGATYAYVMFQSTSSTTTTTISAQDPASTGYYVTQDCYIVGSQTSGTSSVTNYGTLVVNYVDGENNKIASSETYTALAGAAYSTTSKVLKGYEWNGTQPNNAAGVYTSGTTTVTYVYEEVVEEGTVYTATPSKEELEVGETFAVEVVTSANVSAIQLRDAEGTALTYDDITSVTEDDMKKWTITLSVDTVGSYTYTVYSRVDGGEYIASEVTAAFAVVEAEDPPVKANTITVKADGNGTVSIKDSGLVDTYTYNYTVGETVTIEAQGDTFRYWTNANNKVVSTEASFTIIAATDEVYTAMFAESRTVSFMSKGQLIKTIVVAADATEIAADDYPMNPFSYGHIFTGWDMKEEEILAALQTGDVIVNAVHEKILDQHYIAITGGKTSGLYETLTLVTVTADEPEAGKQFSHWVDGDGNIMNYKSTYNFYVTTDIDLTAVFVDAGTDIEKKVLIQITNVAATVETNKLSFTAERALPEGVTLVQHGIILIAGTASDKDAFIIGASGVLKGTATTTGMNGTYVLNKGSVSKGDTWSARGYVIYKDAAGEVQTVYGDIVTETMP